MEKGTERTEQVLAAVRQCVLSGVPPTVRELCEITGIPSSSTVWKELRRLQEAGLVRLNRGAARGITLAEPGGAIPAHVPVVLSVDPITGVSVKAPDGEFVLFNLPEKVTGSVFAVRLNADGGGMQKGDIAVFCRAHTVPSDVPAILSVDGVLTPGRVTEEPDGTYVETHEGRRPLTAEADIAVVGKVLGLIRRFF